MKKFRRVPIQCNTFDKSAPTLSIDEICERCIKLLEWSPLAIDYSIDDIEGHDYDGDGHLSQKEFEYALQRIYQNEYAGEDLQELLDDARECAAAVFENRPANR